MLFHISSVQRENHFNFQVFHLRYMWEILNNLEFDIFKQLNEKFKSFLALMLSSMTNDRNNGIGEKYFSSLINTCKIYVFLKRNTIKFMLSWYENCLCTMISSNVTFRLIFILKYFAHRTIEEFSVIIFFNCKMSVVTKPKWIWSNHY